MIGEPRATPERRVRPEAAQQDPGGDPSFAELASQVLENAKALAATELRLAKAEAKRSATRAAKGGALLAAAAVLGLATAIMGLVALLVILAAIGIPLWLAAILTTLIAAACTAWLALKGIGRLRAEDLWPGRTVAQLNKDRLAAKEQIE